MFTNYGFYLLFSCAILTGYGFLASLAAAKLRHRRLYRSAKMSLTTATIFCLTASGFLWYSLFTRDYSLLYVFKNSSNDLPSWYTLSAFWSSLEGSHFLWMTLLFIVSTIAVWTHAKDNEHIMPYVSAALQAVLCWMSYLAITYSDPFAAMIPKPANGQGMNALLQNPYMAIHPPSLFVGYTATAIPFAYAVAALAYGDVTEGWLKSVRRWALFGWCFLTAAIFLGGRWAYVELGWSGYWAWDPVENSSFMPWLLTTSLLHGLIVQEKLGALKRLTILLSGFAFVMGFFGTFITRSGVISSVHSFAESPIGPNYLAFIATVMLSYSLLYGFRAQRILPSEVDKVWGVSKESALVVTQFLLLTLTTIVFTGTIFPIISDAVSAQKISIQAPYFNSFAPYIGLGLTVAIAVGNLMHFQSPRVTGGTRIMLVSALLAIPFMFLFAHFGEIWSTPKIFAKTAQLIGVYLIGWAGCCLVFDLWVRAKILRFNWRLLLRNNAAYCGAFVAHIGVLAAILGFLGNYRGIEKEVTLKGGESTELFGYTFRFDSMTVAQEGNATLYQAPLFLSRDGKDLGKILPARSKYPTKSELLHEISVTGGLWHDLYIVLADFDKTSGKEITLQIHINHTVRVVWIGAFLMVLGGFLSLSDRFRGEHSRDVVGGGWETTGMHV